MAKVEDFIQSGVSDGFQAKIPLVIELALGLVLPEADYQALVGSTIAVFRDKVGQLDLGKLADEAEVALSKQQLSEKVRERQENAIRILRGMNSEK